MIRYEPGSAFELFLFLLTFPDHFPRLAHLIFSNSSHFKITVSKVMHLSNKQNGNLEQVSCKIGKNSHFGTVENKKNLF